MRSVSNKKMDTDDLSIESYQIIVLANEISDFMKTDFGVLATKCKNEKEYLDKAFTFAQNILYDQADYLESWMIEDRLDEKKLIKLTKYIKQVQKIPEDQRSYDEW